MSRGITRWSSFAATAAFALYNGALGLYHSSLWHGSICTYYILLSLLRGALLLAEGQEGIPDRWRKRVFYGTSGLLLTLNGALMAPVALMVLSRRPVSVGLVPAIFSAAYTTYKITAAAVGLRKRSGNMFSRELGVLRFDDALVSVLVLQNTLITVVDGKVSGGMFRLAAVTSGVIFLLIFGAAFLWYRRESKNL